jgi:hypothetical protein
MRVLAALALLTAVWAPAFGQALPPDPAAPILMPIDLPAVAPRSVPTTPPPVVERMYLMNSDGWLNPGDRLHVVLLGTPGGYATFDVGLAAMAVMTELRPGRYEGTLDIVPGMEASAEVLRGHLTVETQTRDARLSTPITLGHGYPGEPSVALVSPRTALLAEGPTPSPSGAEGLAGPPTLPSPAAGRMFVDLQAPFPGEAVSSVFAVTGQTVPYAAVDVAALRDGVVLASARGEADASGWFTIPLHLSSAGPLQLQVVASNPTSTAARRIEYPIATGP